MSLARAGAVRVVAWSAAFSTSRSHYCYDQAIVYQHALLGVSHCGPQSALDAATKPLVVIAAMDLDEYFYTPVSERGPGLG